MAAATPKKQTKPIAVPATRKPDLFAIPYRTKCIILCCICFVFYANSLLNKYALDDNITIVRNSYVQMGLKGIPKIMANDSYASYYTEMGGNPSNQLSGGRFRPLSEIVFATEQQIFGDSDLLPGFRHLINILAYMACVLSIFYFLEKFLLKKIPWGRDIAFVAAVLFAIHPLHTEVVANIKSLDEILSILFIMLTFIFGLKYLEGKQTKYLILGVVYYLLSLLAKEYAVTLLFFIPFVFYLLQDKKPESALIASLPYYGAFVVYILLRLNAVGFHGHVESTDILSNPYLYATHMQKIATEWFVLGKYVALLLFPYPLSSDYNYNQIAYHNFSDITVLLSMLIYIGLLIWGIRLALKKNVLSFAVFFFLLNVFMISNFILDIGATMGERLVFHSSLGVVIILAYYLFKALSKQSLKAKRNVVIGVLSGITIVCLGETVVRNAEWMDDQTLFIHDALVVPKSCLANNNASYGYLSYSERKENTVDQAKAFLDSAHKYSLRALHWNPKYEAAFLNLGGVFLHQGLLDSAKYCWDMVNKLHFHHPSLKSKYALLSSFYMMHGLDVGKSGNPASGITSMQKALVASDSLVAQYNYDIGESGIVLKNARYARYVDSTVSDIWYNLGGAYFTLQKYDSAKYAWAKALQFEPNNIDAQRGLQALSGGKQ